MPVLWHAVKKLTKKKTRSDTEALASQLSNHDKQYRRINDGLALLNYDATFHYQQALIEQLNTSFNYMVEHKTQDNFIIEWAKTWSHAYTSVTKFPDSFPASSVPSKGHNTAHPTLTAFSVQVLVECEFIHVCRVLLFKALYLDELTKSSASEIARQIRLSCRVGNKRIPFVKTLRRTKENPLEDYLNEVSSYLENQTDFDDFSTDEKRFVESLIPIFDLKIRKTKKQKNVKTTRERTRTHSSRQFSTYVNIDDDTIDNDLPLNGSIVQSHQYTKSENVYDIEDSVFSARVDTSDDHFEANDIENFNTSLRWLYNTRLASLSSTARYNRIERHNFLRLLRQLATQDNETSLVIYLHYLLSLSIDEIWNLKIGEKADISLLGFYYKPVPPLESGYVPLQETSTKFEDKLTRLKLQLPNELTTLLKTVSVKDGSKLTKSFSKNRHEMKDHMQSLLKEWRRLGNTRFHYNRNGAALSTELMILTNDPLVTYLLSGSEIHQSPTLRFYRPTSQSYLDECWIAVVKKLLQLEAL